MGRSDKPSTPIDLSKVSRYSISNRSNKTKLQAFGRPMKEIDGADFFESLPDFFVCKRTAKYLCPGRHACAGNTRPHQSGELLLANIVPQILGVQGRTDGPRAILSMTTRAVG